MAQTLDLTFREWGAITCKEILGPSLCPKGLSANLCHIEDIGAHLRAASTARTERRRKGRERRERKSKGRGTTSVTPRTGRKTGTDVTEGTSRSITGWIGIGPPPEPDARVAAPHGQPVLVEGV